MYVLVHITKDSTNFDTLTIITVVLVYILIYILVVPLYKVLCISISTI